MTLPIATTSEPSDEFNVSRVMGELLLPSTDLILLLHPAVDHHLLQWLDVPVLVTCNPLGPTQEFIQQEGAKAFHMKTRALLQRKPTQRISEAEEMKVNQHRLRRDQQPTEK